MSNRSKYEQNFVGLQCDVFRIAKRDHGLTVKRLALLTEIPATTLQSWANGTTLPAWAMMQLAEHVPDELMSILSEPSSKFIGTLGGDDEGNLDDLGRATAGFTSALLDAKDPASPGGTTIVPMERGKLRESARRVASVARAVAA